MARTRTKRARTKIERFHLKGCPRCGGEHKKLVLKPLPQPYHPPPLTPDKVPHFSKWALCPKTKGPILFRTRVRPEDFVFEIVAAEATREIVEQMDRQVLEELNRLSGATAPIDEGLVTFLYLLMRDELPLGTVIQAVNESRKLGIKTVFTNKHLEALARELAGRLLSPLRNDTQVSSPPDPSTKSSPASGERLTELEKFVAEVLTHDEKRYGLRTVDEGYEGSRS